MLRTFQRRVRAWRLAEGPEKEVFFTQDDKPGEVLAFELRGRGKTHFPAALGRELVLRHSKRVLFRPAFKRIGQLLAAKHDLRLENEFKKLDRYDVLILEDIGYVQQCREEMEALFTTSSGAS